jgi:AraC family transcriptional regulator of arabinose operon
MDPRIQIVSSIVEDHLGGTLKVAELAQSVNLSSSRLRHLFKAETGQTVAQYLKDMRLEKARVLLRSTLLTVKEVMHRVGVANDSHFARDFKESCGLSPTQYRDRNQEPSSIDRSVEVLADSDNE